MDYDWTTYTPDDRAVLCFLRRDPDDVLLIRKKRGLGAGKINAPGGKLEDGETPQHTAIRETEEEVGLRPEDPAHHGTLRFAFTDGYRLEVSVFVAYTWSGVLTETDEAVPFWVTEEKIPFHEMWEDDAFWLPEILGGSSVEAEMLFDEDRMLTWDIRFSDGRRCTGRRINGASYA